LPKNDNTSVVDRGHLSSSHKRA